MGSEGRTAVRSNVPVLWDVPLRHTPQDQNDVGVVGCAAASHSVRPTWRFNYWFH